jgi:hypothetical protein
MKPGSCAFVAILLAAMALRLLAMRRRKIVAPA